MPRNQLKSFPTAILRRGLVHFHPACHAVVEPMADSPGNDRTRDVDRSPVPVEPVPIVFAPSMVASERVTPAPFTPERVSPAVLVTLDPAVLGPEQEIALAA